MTEDDQLEEMSANFALLLPFIVIVLGLIAALLSGCAVQPAAVQPEPTQTAEPTATPEPVYAAPMTCTVTAGALNVRQAPSASAPAIDWLRKGDVISLAVMVGDWANVGQGWAWVGGCE